MANQYLDKQGLVYLWSKIKAAITAAKVTKTSELTNDSGFLTSTDVSDKADKSDIPTKVSQLTNDSGYLTSHQDISGKVDKVTGKGLSTNDYTTAEKDKLAGIAEGATNVTKVSQLTNDSGYLTSHQDISGKVDKVTGKGLSTNDYTTDEKTKLAGVAAGAEVNVQSNWSETDSASDAYIANKPTKVSAFTNDAGYLTTHQTIPTGTTSASGIVQLSTSTSSTSTTLAATPSAVKAAYDLANGKQSPATTLSGYGITDAYTKSQIDSMVSAALNYRGSVESFSALPSTGLAKGDVYNVVSAGGTDAHGTAIKAGDNVAYNGTGWDDLGGTVDLSGYIQATDTISNTEIDTIVAG